MPGGLLQLVAYGIEDEILISNPEITFFKTVHRKYTNFTIDTLSTIHDIKYSTVYNILIPKTGELLNKIFIKLELPKITTEFISNLYDEIFELISTQLYNYTINNYNTNESILTNLIELLNNEINSLNNLKVTTEYLSVIDQDNNIVKIYNLYETSNLMSVDLNLNNSIIMAESKYYNSRNILNTMIHDDIDNHCNNFKVINFLNEKNYFINTDYTYTLNYIELIKSIIGIIYLNKNSDKYLNSILLYISLELSFNNILYQITNSYNYYNNFKNELFILTMPNEFFRQVYSMNKYGYDHIDDIMSNLRINGQIMTYDNNFTTIPNYLVFIDKTDKNVLIPIIITDIHSYTPSEYSTISNYYYNYTGYIANIDYFNNLISYSSTYYSDILLNTLKFEKVTLCNDDGLFRQIDIILTISHVSISKSSDNLSYLYQIEINTSNITYEGTTLDQVISSIIQAILPVKYAIYIYNYFGRNDYKYTTDNNLYKTPPMAILLLDNDNPPTYSTDNIFIINFKNTYKQFDINNVAILSPYIPIITTNNTLFDTNSTDTDYKYQIQYLIQNNKNTDTAIDTVTSYSREVFKIINQYYNTSPLTIKNTINSDYTINIDSLFNTVQLNQYINYLSLNNKIDNTILTKINNNFILYQNNLVNAYQYIIGSSNNKIVFTEVINIYKIINSYISKISITDVPFKQSFDTTSLITLIINNKTGSDISQFIYNDIVLKQLPETLLEELDIFKIRLYPYRIPSNKTPINQSSILFNNDQVNYVIPGNEIYFNKNIPYNNHNYIIRYYYKFIHLIESNSEYIDVYVKTRYILFEDGIQIEPTDETKLFIDQQFSYIPTKFDTRYGIQSETNPNILYVMFYTDNWPSLTGDTTINSAYMMYTYFLYKPMVESSFEDIWFLHQYYSNIIYDIISFPSYYYQKFNYDLYYQKNPIINVVDNSINNIYFNEIYNIIMYNAYKSFLNGNNNNIANITSLIIQDTVYILSSFFKDPNIIFENFITYLPQSTSLEQDAINPTSYNSFITPQAGYNLLNIFSNNLLLSSEQILNTSFELVSRYDNNLLNYYNNKLIFNITDLPQIVLSVFTNSPEKFITSEQFMLFLDTDLSSTNVLNIITLMSQQIQTDSSGNPLAYPIPITKSTSKLTYNLLNVSTANDILSNLILYDILNGINIINKQYLLNVLTIFKNNLNIEIIENYYEVNTLLIDPIINGSYQNTLVYSTIFNIINNSIKMYFEIYLLRSNVLDSMVDPISYPNSSKQNIITMFTNQITDYTNSDQIHNSLFNLVSSNIITTQISDTIVSATIGPNIQSYSDITALINDPSISDGYYKNEAISYFRGVELIGNILSTLYISINSFTTIITNTLTDSDFIKNNISTFALEVYENNTILSINIIQEQLNKITFYTVMQYTTGQLLINNLNIFNYNVISSSLLINKNIKLIYYDNSGKLTNDFVYICDTINSVTNIINNNTSNLISYNFIDELTKTITMIKNNTLVNQMINLYNIANNNNIQSEIFTSNLMISIVNLYNTYAETAINSVIEKLTNTINDKINSSSNSDLLLLKKITNPLIYDQLIYITDMHYYDTIFYLYSYIISQFYDSNNINLSSEYDQAHIYTKHTIFFNDSDTTYDLTNPIIGPTIVSWYDNYDQTKNSNKYYKIDYFVDSALINIYALFNYLSKVIDDPINTYGPFDIDNTLDGIFMNYVDNRKYFYPIAFILNYINKYSPTFNPSVSQIIINNIMENPISAIIYNNINNFIFLLINIANIYNLSDLINNSISIVDQQLYKLSTIEEIDPFYQIFLLPNLDTYYNNLDQNSNYLIYNYLLGVLQYNINQSSYTNFNQTITDQRSAYTTLYSNIINVNDIGINTETYVNYYNHFNSFLFNVESVASSYLLKKSLLNNLLVTPTGYKTNNTFMNITGTNDLYKAFNNILIYFKTNLSTYQNNISNIDFINVNLNYDKYYSDINSFYNYLINDIKISSYNKTIFTYDLIKYRCSDATKLNNIFTNIMNTEYLFNSLYDLGIKKSLITLNLIQTIDLFNFNNYYKKIQKKYPDTDLSILESDFINISNYDSINGKNIFKIYKTIIRNSSLVINDYIGIFFTTNLMNINEQNKVLLTMQNTKVSDKLTNAILTFTLLSKYEQYNVIKLYTNMKYINAYLIYIYENNNINTSIQSLSLFPIMSEISNIIESTTYTYYDIIMSQQEYNLIFNSILKYNFNTGSIGILIFNSTTHLKYDINNIYLKTKLDPNSLIYTFTLYRKTDLPSEYKYLFDLDTLQLLGIDIKNSYNDNYKRIYNQISIFGDLYNTEKLIQSFYVISFGEANNILINTNNILSRLDTINIANLINYFILYDSLFLINELGIVCNNINSYIINLPSYSDIIKNIIEPFKYFNYLYYGTYLQSNMLLNYNLNYSSNLVILLYNYFPIQMQNLFLSVYAVNKTHISSLIEYIKYIETNYNSKADTLNIGFTLETVIRKYNVYTPVDIVTSDVNQIYIIIKSDISIQSASILKMFYDMNDYTVNFINNLYNYNITIENTVLHLMNNIWSTYEQLYIDIMNKLLYLNRSVFDSIDTYVKTNTTSATPYPTFTSTLTEIVQIGYINTSYYYSNIINSDEQKLNLTRDKFVLSSSENIIDNFDTITINNLLISESQQFIRINKSDDLTIYKINHIENHINKLYVNYPYDLIFVPDIINIINNRVTNNIIVNDYSGTYIIYKNNTPITYEKKYIDFLNDFLVSFVVIDGSQYDITTNIFFKPFDNSIQLNIPLSYNISNITELSSNHPFVLIKHYIISDSIYFYINNLNQLYISTHYYINNDQTTIKPKIIAIDDYKSIVTIDSVSDIDQVNSIDFGLRYILSIVNDRNILIDPSLIYIYNTEDTLLNLFDILDTNELINMILYFNTNKNNMLTKIENFNSNYYKNLNQNLLNFNYIYTIMESIVISNINDTSNILNSSFLNIYPNLKNSKNYKLNLYNLTDNVNLNDDIVTILSSIINDNLNLYNLNELTYLNERNTFYQTIIQYINKPNIATFSYIPWLADFIFDSIDLQIDGISVDELKYAYMYIYHNILTSVSKRIGYSTINNNNENLLIDSNTKDNVTLYIDIPLYFSQIPGLALPLISSIYSKFELVLKIKNLDDITIRNSLCKLKYKNNIKMTVIYSVIYLDDYERELFSTMRHEYLYERKIYNSPIQNNVNILEQSRYHVPLEHPIKDFFYYVQSENMINAKQYYNFTFDYLLPELYMTTRYKLIYLDQVIKYGYYDNDIYILYTNCKSLMITKINKLNAFLILSIDTTNLQFLYNNLTDIETSYIETLFKSYYELKLGQLTISNSVLYLNSVERFNVDGHYSKISLYQSYNNMIPGLYNYNFSLHALEYQPSGYANFLSLKPEFKITLAHNSLKYNNQLVSYIIARSYNIIRFISGIAGKAW